MTKSTYSYSEFLLRYAIIIPLLFAWPSYPQEINLALVLALIIERERTAMQDHFGTYGYFQVWVKGWKDKFNKVLGR